MDIIYPISRVYKLVSDNGLIYIGSTKKPLNDRLSCHIYDYKMYLQNAKHFITSFELFKENCSVEIILIEETANISKTDLHKRERHFIETMECVNKVIPTRTRKEYRDSDNAKLLRAEWDARHPNRFKEYYEKNKDALRIRIKTKRDKSKERFNLKYKEYRERNKEEVNKKKREYYEKNKEHFNQKKREYRVNCGEINIVCSICNCEIRREGKTRHEKSKKHKANIAKLNP